jgi:surface antigen
MRIIPLATAVLALSACANMNPPHLSDTLNETDLERLRGAHWYAFNGTIAQQAVWSNVGTGNGGTVRALAEFPDPATGLPCRKVVEDTRSTAGARDIRIGTACQKADGDLVVVYTDRAEE